MRNLLIAVVAVVGLVLLLSQDASALGRRGGNMMGNCNVQTAPLPTPAKAQNLSAIPAPRVLRQLDNVAPAAPVQVVRKGSLTGVDLQALAALKAPAPLTAADVASIAAK